MWSRGFAACWTSDDGWLGKFVSSGETAHIAARAGNFFLRYGHETLLSFSTLTAAGSGLCVLGTFGTLKTLKDSKRASLRDLRAGATPDVQVCPTCDADAFAVGAAQGLERNLKLKLF
jgi:hypothetical protein